MGLCCIVLGATEWVAPELPPFVGRWSGFKTIAYEVIGLYGIAMLWLALGALLLALGLALWARERLHPGSAQ